MAKTKKRQNKDFKKVKAKLGRKLKPANEVRPEVKVGHIRIREQFTPGTDESDVSKKINVKDLLRYCGNGNVKAIARHKGIQQLLQHLSSQPKTLCNYFYRIFAAMPILFIDEDVAIRSEARKLLSWIFANKDFDQIFDPGDPDLNLLLPYLRLAMNNSREDVKIDSLALLDIYMTSPRLILYGTASLLKDLMMLISAQRRSQLDKTRGQSNSAMTSHSKGGLLATNPASKLSQQKWRSRVLERLDKFFQVLYDEVCDETSRLSDITKYGSHVDVKSVLCDPAITPLLVDDLIPLLFECWIETGFQKSGSEQMLDQTSINILQTTLKVMRCLTCIMAKLKTVTGKSNLRFLSTLEKYCIQHFCSGFPFRIVQRGSRKDIASKDVSVLFNILVCEILLHFVDLKSRQLSDDFVEQMAHYVTAVLEKPHPPLSGSVREVVSKLIAYHAKSDKEVVCEKLVAAVVGVVHGQVPKSDLQRKWFDLCSALLVTSAFDNRRQWDLLAKFPSVQNWFASLPDVYLEMGKTGHEDSPKVNELINQLIVLQQQSCQKRFTDNLSSYLDERFLRHLTARTTAGGMYSNLVTRFFDTLCLASKIDLSSLQSLIRLCLRGIIPPNDFAYFCDKIAESFRNQTDDLQMASVDFLDFRNILTNAIVGGFQDDIKAVDNKNRDQASGRGWIYVDDGQPSVVQIREAWERQRTIVQVALQTFGLLPDCVERLKEVLGFIKATLATYRCLGVLNACSLGFALHCCSFVAGTLGPSNDEIGEFVRQSATDLMFGLIECTNIELSEKTLKDYVEAQPPLEVVVHLLTSFSVIFDEIFIRAEKIIQEQKQTYGVAKKLIKVLTIIKRDERLDQTMTKTIERLLIVLQRIETDK